MQNIYKDGILCDTIKEAIGSFGKKNGTNGMEYFAEQLGYHGVNKSIQLHNRLSPANNEKFMKLDELFFIMKQMDKDEQKSIVDEIANKYGFYIALAAEGKAIKTINLEASVSLAMFEVGGTFGALADEMAMDLQDGVISEAEAKRLKKTLKELREKARSIEDVLDKYVLG